LWDPLSYFVRKKKLPEEYDEDDDKNGREWWFLRFT
jgi:hypothetical protein